MPGPDDPQQLHPSVACLRMLQESAGKDDQASVDTCVAAFDRMCRLPSGWWGDGTFYGFARKTAEVVVRKFTPHGVVGPSAEDVAHEALIAFAAKAHRIRTNPKAFFYGLCRNLYRRLLKKTWPEYTAVELNRDDDHLLADEQDAEDPGPLTSPPGSTERIRQLIEALRNPNHRFVMRAVFFSGQYVTPLEIARQRFGPHPTNEQRALVRQWLKRAKAKLIGFLKNAPEVERLLRRIDES